VIGSVEQFTDRSSAMLAVAALRREINLADPRLGIRPITISQLVDDYRLRELATDNLWKTHSTKVTYQGYLNKWIVPRWKDHALSAIKAGEVELWRNTKYRKPEDWIFASPEVKGRNPYSGQAIMRGVIRPIAIRIGIIKRIGWHTFRHTYSTLLRANRTDIKVMQELLRHASSRVTLDTYTQAVTDQKREAQSEVVRLFRTPRK
jgi:hypothetical protein